MRVLVVGSGAREHAIAWKLAGSPRVSELFIAPGNAGTASFATNLPISPTDIDRLAEAALLHQVDLTVVGPEAPLARGIADRFRDLGLPIVGPTRAAAEIESSKVFAKGLMERYGIPTARARTFSSPAEAFGYVEKAPLPLVVKADGLAGGKGSFVCATREEAREAIYRCMVAREFGPSGDRVLVEECLQGREVSVFAFTDGEHLSPLVAACDYKRLLDGDQGPNTGGMGSYSPPEFWTPSLAREVRQRIMEPTVHALAQEGRPFTGVLYAGLMLTEEGPKVLEFNCRLGDPEAQVLLPRLAVDFMDLLLAMVEGRVDRCPVEWTEEACVGVVLASPGYPGPYPTGLPIEGLDSLGPEVLVFHAGTRLQYDEREGPPRLVTDGGRVLTVVALGNTLEEARGRAYQGVERVRFPGAVFRRDIARVGGERGQDADGASPGRPAG